MRCWYLIDDRKQRPYETNQQAIPSRLFNQAVPEKKTTEGCFGVLGKAMSLPRHAFLQCSLKHNNTGGVLRRGRSLKRRSEPQVAANDCNPLQSSLAKNF